MKSFQNLSYSQGVSLICLGGFAGSVMLAVLIKDVSANVLIVWIENRREMVIINTKLRRDK